ncbi:MAG: AfsR/SARP family transcriptional regulator [Frankiaceae bacterium]
MEVRVLGPVELTMAGRPRQLGGTKQRAVLAMLALHVNKLVSVDHLVDGLWGQAPPESAVNAVQVYISRLRKALRGEQPDSRAAPLRRRSPGYLLELEAEQVDLYRFERLAGEGARAVGTDPERAAGSLRAALGLWRGPPLAEFGDEPFAPPEASRLEEKRLAALEARIEADLAVGRHAELVGELRGLVLQHPLRERLHQQLLLSLYRSGRQGEALAAFRQTRQILAEELGVDPCRALQELEAAILAQDRRLDLIAPPEGPLSAASPTPRAAAALSEPRRQHRGPPRTDTTNPPGSSPPSRRARASTGSACCCPLPGRPLRRSSCRRSSPS